MASAKKPEPLRIWVRPDYVAAVSHFVPADFDPSRAHMAGVRFEPCATGGVIVIATDGRALIVLHDPNGFANRAATVALQPSCVGTIKKDMLKRAHSATPATLWIETVATSPWLNTVDMSPEPEKPADRVTYYAAELDEVFPDWRSLAASASEVLSGPGSPLPVIGSNMTRKLAKALEAVDGHFFPPVHYTMNGTNSPIIVRSPAFGDGFVIIAPMRIEEADRALVAWDGLPDFAEAAA
jgi:hypothetical protein